MINWWFKKRRREICTSSPVVLADLTFGPYTLFDYNSSPHILFSGYHVSPSIKTFTIHRKLLRQHWLHMWHLDVQAFIQIIILVHVLLGTINSSSRTFFRDKTDSRFTSHYFHHISIQNPIKMPNQDRWFLHLKVCSIWLTILSRVIYSTMVFSF